MRSRLPDRPLEDAMNAEGGMRMQRIRTFGGPTMVAIALAVMALFAMAILPATAALPMKACQLVTAKDVQGVLGTGYTEEELPSNEVTSYCGYKKGQGTAVGIQLSRQIMDAGQYLETVQTGMKREGKTATPVAGLGRGAFQFIDDKENQMIFYFGKGTLLVSLTVFTGGKPNIDAAKRLGKIAYARLP